MPSLIAWLDASSEEQRRMRDIIRLFADRESRDELGLGQIRDALSDLLFPGTSTLLTRARYLLIVPWAYTAASPRRNPVSEADRFERDVIGALRDQGDYAGLLGMQAGAALKNLPSTIYWSMIRHYGILVDPNLSREDALRMHGRPASAVDIDDRGTRFSAWSPTIPDAPEGFPKTIPGGFSLQPAEAGWLRDRILDRAPGTLFAHLVLDAPSDESSAPWEDPAALRVAGETRALLDHARSFSAVMHGAQLLYNLMLAEQYEAAGLDRLSAPAARYAEQLDSWSATLSGLVDASTWNLQDLLSRVERMRGAPVNPRTRRFVSEWTALVADSGGQGLGESPRARDLIERRERQNKGSQRRLDNPRRIAGWGGGSGAGALVFRWPTVRGILRDIHDGLARPEGEPNA